MNKFGVGERAPWGDFPKVIRNGDLGALAAEPEYQAAKQGDIDAALALIERLLSDVTVNDIRAVIGRDRTVLLPVLAVEETGSNMIPLAMAEVLADRLGVNVELSIFQSDIIGRTDKGADYRLAFNPTFKGDVRTDQKYLILDDTLTMGGTIASLRGYIENRGGKVIAGAVMTAHPGAVDISVKQKMLAAITEKHGSAMNDFWMETFNYGIDKLTQGEAGHVRAAASVDAIRERIIAERNAASEWFDAGQATTEETGTEKQALELNNSAGDDLLVSAQDTERVQQALLENASVGQIFQEALAIYVQEKHEQVNRVEDRLEVLIDQQQSCLDHNQSSRPGLFSMPGTKRTWQNKQSQQRDRLQQLQKKLEVVREIKDGMGSHAPVGE